MKSRLFAAFVALFWLAGATMAQDEQAAIFKNVSGNVKVFRGKTETAATPGMLLMQSDVITSGPDSSGGIVFKDGTRLVLGASSTIEISQYLFRPKDAKYAFSLYLKKGTALYSSGKIAKLAPESINLNTPRAAVGVRGTRFIVKEEGE